MRWAWLLLGVLGCGKGGHAIATEHSTIELRGFSVEGRFPKDWQVEHARSGAPSWTLDQNQHRAALLELEPLPCIGMPCSGDAFRASIEAQDAEQRAKYPGTTVELPMAEVRPGVLRQAERRASRDGPGDEIELSVIYTGGGWDSALQCGGYARGPGLALWRELLELCLSLEVARSPAR